MPENTAPGSTITQFANPAASSTAAATPLLIVPALVTVPAPPVIQIAAAFGKFVTIAPRIVPVLLIVPPASS